MYRNGTEYGRLINFDGGNAFYIQAARGHLRFASGTGGTATGAMEIREQGGADAGYVGIGNYSSFSPSCRLQVHEATASTPISFQLSNNTTGASSTDGLRISNDNSGRVTVYNWEDDDIAFGTGNAGGGGSLAERMIISSGLNFGRVGIGIGPSAQLDIYDATDLTTSGDDIGLKANEILNTSNTVNRAMGAQINAANGIGTVGIEAVVDNTSSNTNIDMRAIYTRCRNTNSSNVANSYNFYAENDGNCTSTNKFGIAAFMTGANITNSYGGFLRSTTTGTNNYGLWAEASGGTTNWAIWANGNAWSTGTWQSSDATLKSNILPMQNNTAIVMQLQPKSYDFNQTVHPELVLPNGIHYGLVAQELEQVVPSLVKDVNFPAQYDSTGSVTSAAFSFKSVNYIEVIPFLIGTIQELKHELDSLKSVVYGSALSPKINSNQEPTQKISLSNVSSIILNQNDPNPFTESTRITFQIPDEVRDAKIIFTSSTGSIINTAIINERGAGELEVYSSELSKGLYTYTLVCDGKVIASKKMVKQ